MTQRLQARGFVLAHEPGGHVLRADLISLPDPVPPPSYVLTHVADDSDVEARVESQRAALAPSDLTVHMYRRVRRTWPYRPELDRIVKTSEGEVVACCTAWLDERNHAGLLKLVSTHPAHQKPGARAAGGGRRAACTPPRGRHSGAGWHFGHGGPSGLHGRGLPPLEGGGNSPKTGQAITNPCRPDGQYPPGRRASTGSPRPYSGTAARFPSCPRLHRLLAREVSSRNQKVAKSATRRLQEPCRKLRRGTTRLPGPRPRPGGAGRRP